MSRWFRMYDGVVDDPKVQRLPAPLFKFWVNALCLASANGGDMPALVDMAFKLRMSEKQVSENLDKLAAAELVDVIDGVSTPHNWNGRQFKSDDSKDRVKAHRQRHKKQDVTVPVTENVTVTVTPPEQRQSRAETEQILPSEVPPAAAPPVLTIAAGKDLAVQSEIPTLALRSRPKEPDLPPWIPPDAWAGFVEMRKKIRQPLTERGALLIIAALKKLRATEDIGAVLDQSTMKNYRGVFPVKHDGNSYGQRSKPPSAHDKLNAGAALFIASLGGDDEQGRPGEADSDADGPRFPLLAS